MNNVVSRRISRIVFTNQKQKQKSKKLKKKSEKEKRGEREKNSRHWRVDMKFIYLPTEKISMMVSPGLIDFYHLIALICTLG